MKNVLLLGLSAIWLSSFLQAQTLTLRAGRLIECTLEEPSLSSKTTAPGDPVLCYLRSAREFGRSAFPRGSYLAGRFSDAKDPGRIAGKGWLKLEFDRLIFPDTDIPIAAKVIAVRRFRVDEEGKVIGQGHPTRDAVAWFVPILWPIDLIRLPAQEPRLTLSGEVPVVLRLITTWTYPVRPTPRAAARLPSHLSRPRIGRRAAISTNPHRHERRWDFIFSLGSF